MNALRWARRIAGTVLVCLWIAMIAAISWDRYHQPGGWNWGQVVAPEVERFERQGVCR